MKVDISDITRVNGASLKLEFEEAPSVEEPVEGYVLKGPIDFSGTLSNINGILELSGHLKADYSTSCYRCLKELGGKLDIRVKENFVSDTKYAEEIDAYVYEGKLLDTDKALLDNIILNLPMKQVCSHECKGLCQKCGINLNEAGCTCTEESIDPRLEKLGEFFNN